MTTWTNPDGNIRRKIDYIMINAKRRNMARTAQSDIMARKYESEQTTPRTNYAALLQRRQEIQETNTTRRRNKTKI